MNTNKEILKERHRKLRDIVMSRYRKREEECKNIEVAFEKYVKEMNEYSKHNFELVKTARSEDFVVFIDSFPVETFTLNFFENEIKYIGPIPKNVSISQIRICVEEHITYSKGVWGKGKNHGFKIKFSLNYQDSPYYKTGRTVAKKILQYVDEMFQAQKKLDFQSSLKNRAKAELEKMFPYRFIDDINNTTFIIYSGNGVKTTVKYIYKEDEDIFEFSIYEVHIGDNKNFKKTVEGLCNI
jgi:hypothetical protein